MNKTPTRECWQHISTAPIGVRVLLCDEMGAVTTDVYNRNLDRVFNHWMSLPEPPQSIYDKIDAAMDAACPVPQSGHMECRNTGDPLKNEDPKSQTNFDVGFSAARNLCAERAMDWATASFRTNGPCAATLRELSKDLGLIEPR